MTEKRKLSRRDFMKGAAAGVVGAAAIGVLGACQETAPAKATADSTSAAQTAAFAGSGQADAAGTLDFEKYRDAKWAFEIPPEPIPEADIADEQEAEVVVIGAGTAGLCTAVSCVEQGLKTILISASEFPVSRGGSNHGIASKIMKRDGIEAYDMKAVVGREMVCAANSIDHKKWVRFLKNNEEAMNWMVDLMASKNVDMALEAGPPESYIPKDHPMYIPLAAHSVVSEDYTAGAGQPLLVQTMADILVEKGGTLIYQMKGCQLLRGDDNKGRVSGVIAENLQDHTYHKFIGSKAVVLATGDFSADKDMMAKYCPSMLSLIADDAGEDYDVGAKTTGLYKGDGHKMGIWVGAAWQRDEENCPMVNVAQGYCAQPYLGHCGLEVNIRGERFCNELALHSYTGHQVLMQPDKVAFAIWGTNYAKEGGPWYKRGTANKNAITDEEFIESWEANVGGKFVKGDTIEEVLQQLELPEEETMATIERYNALCEKGEDEDFMKPSHCMVPIKEAPFYGARIGGRFLTVLGGLRTNVNMQVCEEDDTPIPGLYNVGTMVGDFYHNTYTFMMQGLNLGANCLTFGYLTGKYIAENE
ncbi:MAG: FAD-dependent oxidoreductase [Lachnospiraceae bacterium]|nr:FAD-dependent oxidoreductase [Lachnospiraceae bacterium]